ncbi:MAG: Undecaprenyl phosphate-alpha-4-amino-4-deoxy-L-arabinose arabinosyl transferase [Alphaproteobacteria bacterium MarineAlpha2_Bin1]|nr:MAG: Undecaprenyl phosphate-alpha-4-amino-4-deoxy-L-arabinose arabinosyl transferase [Alphaproteobacteria bacterium MarineAlpha2_Bin1]
MIKLSYLCSIIISIIFILLCIILRPVLPLDETRYLSVAWDMWLSKDYIVPKLNGELYHHKPPLLFWFINFFWNLFGVNETIARLVGPIFSLGVIINIYLISKLLWPRNNHIIALSPIILLSLLLWLITSSLTMFDVMLTFFFTLSLVGILIKKNNYYQKNKYNFLIGNLIYGIAVGFGILTKGPVILVFSIPVYLLFFIWDNSEGKYKSKFFIFWFLGFIFSLLIILFISLSWALYASKLGGDEFKSALLWSQSANRVISGMSHERSWWWYLSIFPVIFFPWIFMPIIWKSFLTSKNYSDQGFRFCAFIIVSSFILLSIFADKQPHYLVPIIPIFGIFISYLSANYLHSKVSKINYIPLFIILILYIAIFIILFFNDKLFNIDKQLNIHNIFLISLIPFISVSLIFIILLTKKILLIRYIFFISIQNILFIIFIHLIFNIFLYDRYDLQKISNKINALKLNGDNVAYIGKYHGQFNFLGRLTDTIDVIDISTVSNWLDNDKNTYVIYNHREMPKSKETVPFFSQKFRGRTLSIWKKKNIIKKLNIFK